MVDLIWDSSDWDSADWAFEGDQDAILNFMLDTLPHWWNKTGRSSPGSNTFEILRAFAEEFNLNAIEIAEMRKEVFVNTSTSTFLDSLGKFFLLTRKINETDVAFRGRIKSFRATFAGGGTQNAIENSIFQEFDDAIAIVTDTPGTSWAKADVTISNSEWVTKIQGEEAAYFALLDNVKAAGIFLTTVITIGIIPEILDLLPHAEVVDFGVGQLITETQAQADALTFGVSLDIGGVGDLIWDVNNWDENNWTSEIFKAVDIFSIGVALPITETTTLGGEVVVIGLNFQPVDIMSQGPDVLTFAVQLGLTDTNLPTDIVTFGVGLDLSDTTTLGAEDVSFGVGLEINDTNTQAADDLTFTVDLTLTDSNTPLDIVTFGVGLEVPLESISHAEDVTQQIFLNIPNNLIWDSGNWDFQEWSGDEEFAHSEDVTFGVTDTLTDNMSNLEDIDFAFNMIWDGAGQEGDWDSPNWN